MFWSSFLYDRAFFWEKRRGKLCFSGLKSRRIPDKDGPFRIALPHEKRLSKYTKWFTPSKLTARLQPGWHLGSEGWWLRRVRNCSREHDLWSHVLKLRCASTSIHSNESRSDKLLAET